MRHSIGPMRNGLRGRSARLGLTLAAATFMYAAPSPVHAKPPNGTFVTFDVPGGAFDTIVDGINPAGAVTGCTFDGTVNLGFVRAPNGAVTTIAVPGSTSTFVGSECGGPAGPPINPAGAIVGSYTDIGGITHGFVRSPDGIFTRFDAPGGVNTDFVCCITPAGAVAGISLDASYSVGHGFLRAPNGTFAMFDSPGSTFTAPTGINPEVAISGVYFDANFIEHGFFRARDGTITTFDAPGAVNGTEPHGINPAGAIVGRYLDANFAEHGFLRAPDGNITIFDVPSSVPLDTSPVGINPAGAIVGTYNDETGTHGFIRVPDGTFTTVDPPRSAATFALGINAAGAARETTSTQQAARRTASYSSRISRRRGAKSPRYTVGSNKSSLRASQMVASSIFG